MAATNAKKNRRGAGGADVLLVETCQDALNLKAALIACRDAAPHLPVAVSATIEFTPLFLLVPSLFVNVRDPSALAQLVARADLRQNLLLLCALNVPIGPAGSEYGGIETPIDGRYFSTGPGIFAQLAWYF